jgi:predicted RNA polymerase sigma factor
MLFFEIVKTLLSLFPLIIAAIQAIEQAFPHANQGAAKLEMVKGVIANAYSVGNASTVTLEKLTPGIESIVKNAVGIFNAVGVFKEKGAAAGTATIVGAITETALNAATVIPEARATVTQAFPELLAG